MSQEKRISQETEQVVLEQDERFLGHGMWAVLCVGVGCWVEKAVASSLGPLVGREAITV